MFTSISIAGAFTILMVMFMAFGVPVAMALGLAGLSGLWLIGGPPLALGQLSTVSFSVTANYAFAVLPTFLLMGNLATSSGMVTELYTAADRWLGHLKGGLYLATISGAAGFAAISGSPLVNATVFTRLALPEMLRLGYSKSISGASIASAGTLAALIPPSIGMVIYGILTEQSIGKLMIAGIIPGIMTAVGYCLMVMVMVRINPKLAPADRPKASRKDRWSAIGNTWSIMLLFVFIMTGIYGGFFSPSAAGAAGAFGAILITLFRRKLTASMLGAAMMRAAETTAMLFIIVIGGMIYSRMLVLSGFVVEIVDFTAGFNLSPTMLLIIIGLMYVILGCFMEGVSLQLVTIPFVFPIISAAGIDPIFFGIFVIIIIEIGAITPPVGLNLFATVGASEGKLKLEDMVRGIYPFVLLNVAMLLAIVIFPQLVLWLPNNMQF
ncbi:TRAP transporter large permease [Mariluticola halotolerans]|uniref:TRAP transporter large permease n=1 Tax=Mariluticola halotolerans TaxID=2909283 RepID=UPI0026E25CD1|nr:TRAP transporter large permease [Mariluticola halotolerans]UJQ94184.1 TRAP transporter large permease [Mariluticola halotolerans]